MSWDCYAVDEYNSIIHFDERHYLRDSSMYPLGPFAHLSITANYIDHYRRVFKGRFESAPDGLDGLDGLDGKLIAESLPVLRGAFAQLSGKPNGDYWSATEGNARAALEDLTKLGELAIAVNPDASWRIARNGE